jgi:hypothetical protein
MKRQSASSSTSLRAQAGVVLAAVSTIVGAGLFAGLGCQNQGPSLPPNPEPLGAVELSLDSVPDGAACLRVSVAGTRSLTRLFALTPGSTPTFAVDRLPIGIVTVDAQVFDSACMNLGAATSPPLVPTWVLDAPALVRVDPSAVSTLALNLIRNGRLSVSVDFEAPAWINPSRAPVELAVIGDTPYGAAQIADLPNLIAAINGAAPGLSEIVHLGDIKNGSSRCDTSYFQYVLDNFSASSLPLVYTPGDNEWTDCHRANNGAYDPLERLATIRSMFFPVPGLSLGQNKKQVLSQSFFAGSSLYVENAIWLEAGTVFLTLDVPGSNNSLVPWYTDDTTGSKMDDPTRRIGEEIARNTANLAWLDRAFTLAGQQSAAAVIIVLQADMWDGTPVNGFDDTVQKIAALTAAFARPVLLLEGDSHIFKVDNPLAMGDPIHGVTTPVGNLTRIVVQGSTTAPLTEWLRLRVDPAAAPPFSWTRQPR